MIMIIHVASILEAFLKHVIVEYRSKVFIIDLSDLIKTYSYDCGEAVRKCLSSIHLLMLVLAAI